MDEPSNADTQKAWQAAAESLFCGRCHALRLLVWKDERGEQPPQHAISRDGFLIAVHCDYFRRRIERPDHLLRCGAFEERGASKRKGQGRARDRETAG